MPEGDAVWRTATRLHRALAGQVLVESDLRWPDIATADLTGLTTIEVVPRGKHILHRLSGGLTLHSHLRMEGQWRIEATATLKPGWRHVHELRALVAAADWTALGLRLGMLDLVATAREQEVVGHLGPDLLDPAWDADEAALAAIATDNLTRSTVPVGEALLDQRNLAGLGTIWAAETLFAERVWPWTPAADLDGERLRRLVDRAHVLLRRAIEPRAALTATGEARQAWVYGRAGRPCRRCATIVRVAPIGTAPRERNLYHCPRCQASAEGLVGVGDHA